MRKLSHKHTLTSSYLASVTQAIVVNFLPLLFLTLQSEYNVTLSMLGVLITVNFAVQLTVDFIATKLVDKIGYRVSLVGAHILAALGFVLLAVLPPVLSNPYVGLMIAVVVYAAGGGIIEVVASPVVESCPVKNKKAQMAMLHSFYCWGQMGVVLLSTLFFVTVGIAHWKWLALLWAILPVCNAVYLLFVPMFPLVEEGKQMKVRELLKTKVFWIFLVLMVMAGAAEQSVSQWSSAFAEAGLKVQKTLGDLFGPCLFAFLMGLSRLLYSLFSEKINLRVALLLSGILCVASYLIITFSPWAVLSLIGCGLAGFSVGIMWPGIFSYASMRCPGGGTAMFALFAFGGDIGCSLGPSVVGAVADAAGGLSAGISAAIVFPIIFVFAMILSGKRNKSDAMPKL